MIKKLRLNDSSVYKYLDPQLTKHITEAKGMATYFLPKLQI